MPERAELRLVHAREHGDGEELGLCPGGDLGAASERRRPSARVDREIVDAELDRRADRAGHRRGDIEELQIEEAARTGGMHQLDGARAVRREELEPNFKDADLILQQLDEALGFTEIIHIEREDETIARLRE